MADSNETLQTALYPLHIELGAKMVPFAGYAMPVQYKTGIMGEHQHTRSKAGLFDVSHMGQIKITGANTALALESIMPMDIVGLAEGRQRYGLLTNDNGGINDDLMITNAGSHYLLVVNAACKDQDFAYLQDKLSDLCDSIEMLDNRSLLALQGPRAATVLESLGAQINTMVFMTAAELKIDGIPCFATRSGYSGEDGFEISVESSQALKLAQSLLAHEDVLPIGLGARDSLRLESGLCLYGHDIDADTTPVEASLNWAISKLRREGGERAGGFPGAEVILPQFSQKPDKRRVGIQPGGRAPVREGAEIQDSEGNSIGHVTSGGFGPTMAAPVAMGYVKSGHHLPGTELFAIVRGKQIPVSVVKLPFVPHNYVR